MLVTGNTSPFDGTFLYPAWRLYDCRSPLSKAGMSKARTRSQGIAMLAALHCSFHHKGEDFRIHDVRHMGATRTLRASKNLRAVKKM